VTKHFLFGHVTILEFLFHAWNLPWNYSRTSCRKKKRRKMKFPL